TTIIMYEIILRLLKYGCINKQTSLNLINLINLNKETKQCESLFINKFGYLFNCNKYYNTHKKQLLKYLSKLSTIINCNNTFINIFTKRPNLCKSLTHLTFDRNFNKGILNLLQSLKHLTFDFGSKFN